MDIAYKNDGFYSKENINTPILIEGVVVGSITDVDDDFVYGVIWDKYLSRRIFADNKKLCDVSINIQ